MFINYTLLSCYCSLKYVLPFLLFTCSMNVIFRGCCCDILDSSVEVAESRSSLCWGDFSVDLRFKFYIYDYKII